MILPILTEIWKEPSLPAWMTGGRFMYYDHWNMARSPFTNGSQKPGDFFVGRAHEEVLARLDYLTTNRQRLGLVAGMRGVGKSSLLAYVQQRMESLGKQVLSVGLLGVDVYEFATQLSDELGLRSEKERPLASLWGEIFDHLIVSRYQRVDTVILLDDADEAEEEVLTAVARMAQWQPFTDSRLTCREDRTDLVGTRLLELCDLAMVLPSWKLEDTAAYLKQSISRAGRDAPIFDFRAIEELHRLSCGRIRLICQLAELSLLAGADQRSTSIDPATVIAVDNELRLPLLADSMSG